MSALDASGTALIWYLAVTGAAVLAYPLLFRIGAGLPDRGLSIARPVGLAIVTLPIWLLGNLLPLPFSSTTALISAVIVGAIAWALELRRGKLLPFLKIETRWALAVEAATATLFFGYVLIRGFNPEISGTEKPMELAFLNAAIHSDSLPVTDPWFTGEPINYYYFGYAVLGLVAKITGITGGTAFNLGLALTFATATVAAGGAAANLVRVLVPDRTMVTATSGLLAGFLLMFAGNLHAFTEIVSQPSRTLSAGWWQGIGWGSSRVMSDTGFESSAERTLITEFPSFSWILGDLHPHVVAYPWLIASIVLVANLWLVLANHERGPVPYLASASIGVMLGVLYSSNTWDVPIVAALAIGVVILSSWQRDWLHGLRAVGVMAMSALATAMPFMMQYTPATGDTGHMTDPLTAPFPLASSIGYVSWDATSLVELMITNGLQVVLAVMVVAVLIGQQLRSLPARSLTVTGGLIILAIAIALLTQILVVAILGSLLVFTGSALCNRELQTPVRFAVLLLAGALVLLIGVEYFYIRDVFGDRMNTVFKLYFQAWAIFAIALGVLIPYVLVRYRPASRWLGTIVIPAIIIFLMVAASAYTPISLYRWYGDFDEWRGIDGIAYVADVQPAEASAIEWLSDSPQAGTLLEAPGCSYGMDAGIPHNRFSMATGIPTVFGWEGHEFQWRRQQQALVDEFQRRKSDARQIYEGASIDQVDSLIDRYGITHVVVGVHETDGYRSCDAGPPYSLRGIETLRQSGWEVVFERGTVQILSRGSENP